jgi:tripartite-type tricarboxylate transporter receptor subunit TctC
MTPVHDAGRRAVLLRSAALLTVGAAALPSKAAAFPTRPLRLVVPFPPGSGTDAGARLIAQALSALTGVPAIVDNKAGGNGVIAVQHVLGAPADGHTILIGSNTTLSANAATYRKPLYDPLADFAPISLLLSAPVLIAAPAESPYRSFGALVEAARARPGALNYGTGSISYTLYGEWLCQLAGVRATPIAFKGSGDVVPAVIAGTVDFAVLDASTTVELVRTGRLRGLLLGAAERFPPLADVPSATDAGVPAFDAFTWVAAAVSARTPTPIVQALEAVFAKVGADADLRRAYAGQITTVRMTDAQEMRRFQVTEIARWKALVAKVGLALQ